MKRTTTIALALAGLAAFTALIVGLGAGKIFQSIGKIGWHGLLFVVAWQLFVFVILGVAWWIVCPGAPVWTVIWGRLVREGGETSLPFSEVGGLVFGSRALMLTGVKFDRASASSIVDVTAEGIGLVPFLLFGLLMILVRKPHSSLVWPMALGFGGLIAGGIAIYALRHRLAGWLKTLAEKMAKRWVKDAPEKADELTRETENLFSMHWRLAGASLVHVVSWCGGGGNVWIAYHLLGAHPSVLDALAIEAILSAVLSVGFLIPAGLGVQEATYVAVGSLFGLPAHLSLALSLIRRARDLIIGAPALVAWQVLEARALKKKA